MKRMGKIICAVCATVLTVAVGMTLAACGDNGGEDADGVKTYTIDVDGSLSGWQYNFVNINTFGDDPWGLINIEDWGNKKLALGADNTCVGTGCTWSVQLDIMDDTEYNLYLIAHIVGNGTVYSGSGDYTYMFRGEYSEISGGYKLEAPDYVKVSLDGDFTLITDSYDFADYIPSAPWSVDSNTSDDDDFVTGLNDNSNGTSGLQSKLLPSTFDTVFGGATFRVSGSSITSITDVTLPM